MRTLGRRVARGNWNWAKQKPTFRQKWAKVLITHKDVRTRSKNYYNTNPEGEGGGRKPAIGKVLWQMIPTRLGGEAQKVIGGSSSPRKDHNALNWPTNWPPPWLAHFSEINGQ